MRILHVSEVHWGGVVSLLREFTAAQVRDGHDVHVLAPAGMSSFPYTTRHRWRVSRRQPWTVRRALLDLRDVINEVEPDVVHLHSFVAGLLGRLPTGTSGPAAVPTVYQPHAWSFDVFTHPAAGDGMRRWEAWAAGRTDVIVTNCQQEIEEGRRDGIHAPALALGVAVDMEHFHPVTDAERTRLRARLGLTGERILVCVGRLVRQKGQDLLLRAWEERRPPGTHLVLVGPGDTEALRAHAPTQWGRTVLAVGEQADVRPWVWASDLLVLPSRYETVAVAVAEAMACGRPVVATAVNGATETVLDGPLPPAGAVVPVGDMHALLEETSRRLDDASLCRTEGLVGRERAVELFRPEEVARRLEMAYHQAAERQRAAGTPVLQ